MEHDAGTTSGLNRLRERFVRKALRANRITVVRKSLAAVLLLLATVLSVRPDPVTSEPVRPLLRAARDIPAGTTLRSADLRAVPAPAANRPSGALSSVRQARGRVLAGPARAGEPITDVRLVGRANTNLADPEAAGVPVRLGDPAIADLLHAGSRVDVVAPNEQQATGSDGARRERAQRVLAEGATVLAVLAAREQDRGRERVVILALPEETAARVAAVSLTRAVTVTLR